MSNAKNNSPEGDRTDIIKLWKDYEAAASADRPLKRMEILEQIKAVSLKERLAWDYYRACREYVQAGSSRDWKMRDSLQRKFQDEVRTYNEPVMTFYDGRNTSQGKFNFVINNKSRLQNGCNKDFHSNDGNITSTAFSNALLPLITDDYLYALWSLSLRNSWETTDDVRQSRTTLAEELGDRYPDAQLLEYYCISKENDGFRRKEHLEIFADANRDRAVSLLARQDLLRMEFNALTEQKAGQDGFKALRARCEEFEKDRRDFARKEKSIAECCQQIKYLIDDLDERTLSVSITDGVMEVRLRNLDGADVNISDDGGSVLSFHVDNPAGSYYVYDEIKYTLPEINDGEYTVICTNGNVRDDITYGKYTLSAALKQDAAGYSAFLAKSVSGEPVRKADISLKNGNDKVIAEVKGVAFNGFTPLPEEITSKFSKKTWENSLVFSYTGDDRIVRKTKEMHPGQDYVADAVSVNDIYGNIFVDRAAFNPDETVHFKAVIYQGDRSRKIGTVGPGRKLTVNLTDAQGELVSSKSFTTNEFGSIAGDFLLERRERNGICFLELLDGKHSLDEVRFRVDDFVLPTFDLQFDQQRTLYFPGDEMEVTGCIRSYSGHSLAAADIHYTVTSGAKVIKEDILKPDQDGKFSITFLTDGSGDWDYYDINVRVTDATGETLEWSTERTAQKMIPFSVSLENKAEARYESSKEHQFIPNESYFNGAVSDDDILLSVRTSEYPAGQELFRSTLKISYRLRYGEEVLAEGTADPGDRLELNTAGHPSGLYVFEAKAYDKDIYGNPVEAHVRYDILKVKDGDDALFEDVRNLFKVVNGEDIAVQIGSTEGPVWAVVDIYGRGKVLLGSRMIHLDGVKGQAGSLETVRFDWLDSWSDVVTLHIIYFKDNREYTYSRTYDRSAKRLTLPLAFTRFLDKTVPGTPYSFEISTKAGVECAATVFDKSTETIMANLWRRVNMVPESVPYINYYTATGNNDGYGTGIIAGYGRAPMMKSVRSRAAANGMVMMDAMDNDAIMEMEEAPAPVPAAESAAVNYGDVASESISVRENFANTIAFEPFLRSDRDGKIVFNLTTADKLSTYYVQLFAHDKDMNNATLRQEMVVTIPVKVSVVEPQFMYAGDKYNAKVSLSSSVAEAVSGRLRVEFLDGKDYRTAPAIVSYEKNVVLDGYGALSEEFPVSVPGVKDLGIKVSFIADDDEQGSDAVFVCVPVLPAEQTLTEAHSAILRSGESFEALLAMLKGEFVNISGDDAEMRDISLLGMIREAIPAKAEPASINVLDQAEALYVRLLAGRLGADIQTDARTSTEELIARVKACQNSDGGFGWFEGMQSSPVITAVLLQRYASLRDRSLISGDIYSSEVSRAVMYLDKSFFGDNSRPIWCGGLTLEQYVTIRACFPTVGFISKEMDKTELKEFKKVMKEYLVPRKERGLDGYILGKARRMRTLLNLSGSEAGRNLAKDWGVRIATGKRLTASLCRDLDSVNEYAVEHRSGGCYYPNAVMPFRGLLESEAYAHAFIADLLRDCCTAIPDYSGRGRTEQIADGIRLWLMVQKETQHWENDAAFVDAVSTVLDGSEEVLSTRVITLSKTFTKPFDEVKAAGNGMTIERKYYIERTAAPGTKENASPAGGNDIKIVRTELKEGDILKVGDKVIAEYRIWNEENRSFIKVTAPRMACLRPVEQLSGHYGWRLKPLRIDGWLSFSPQGYRSVLTSGTEYWFDTYPEEHTVITEEFFVTQSGTFQMPAVEIESLYAPHYRANDCGAGPVISK